ncbi:hypothetical protein [Asticcacaulis sp. AC460]|uniref:hypothetical protein n=1 Tax=Asticcacaulis sp. AC460 TaxID=1282360 RepID=UPI0012DCEE35|nr:hypothetical protein [Asticcacaulis sp. AC460]
MLTYTVGDIDYERELTEFGGDPVRVHVFVTEDRAEVMGDAEPCKHGLWRAAELSSAEGVRKVVYGTVSPDGKTGKILTVDREGEVLRMSFEGLDEPPLIVAAPVWPVIFYDLDLADLNAVLAGMPTLGQSFDFGVALVWPELGSDLLQSRGTASARFDGESKWQGRTAYHYDVSGALTGELWIDKAQAHILEARFDQSNYPEFRDFHLVLETERLDGEEAWQTLKTRNWGNCPAK